MALTKQYEAPTLWAWQIWPGVEPGTYNVQLQTRSRTSLGLNYYSVYTEGQAEAGVGDLVTTALDNHAGALEADEYELQP